MFLTFFLLGLIVFCCVWIQIQQHQQDLLEKKLRRYDSLSSREETERQLDSTIALKRIEIAELEREKESLNTEIRKLQQKSRELDAKIYLQSIDYYESKYDFTSAGDYRLRLREIKLKQERMRKNNQAFFCRTEWKVGDSRREGKKMTNDLLDLIELAFENECKYASKEVKYNNVDSLINKIENTFKKINKLSEKTDCEISREYLNLKLLELDLKYEQEDKQNEEIEREKELKRQNKACEAIKNARQKAEEAEEREKLHQQELDKVRQEIEQVAQAEVEKRKQLELQIQQLERQIAEDISDREKANRVKWGYIYIISNIGSLRGRDVYRICMTNRSKPDEYIRDMNPAVPFRFDVHFKIFSEDVFDTLEKLHNRFNDKRVNEVNFRRDFFKVSLDEIEEAVKEIARETGVLRIDEFERAPQAYEYRQTLAVRKKNQHISSDDSYLEENEIA